MNPKAVLGPVSILLIGLLCATGEARMMACLERGGIDCYCCPGKAAADSVELLSPCPCSCPSVDQVYPFAQDWLAARVPSELDLLAQRVVLTPDPIFLAFSSLPPQKPPPGFFNPRSLFQSRAVPEE